MRLLSLCLPALLLGWTVVAASWWELASPSSTCQDEAAEDCLTPASVSVEELSFEEDWLSWDDQQQVKRPPAPGEEVKKGGEKGGSNLLPWFIRQVVFLPIVRSGLLTMFRPLSDPAAFGLERAGNLLIETANGTLGAWHVWPEAAGPNQTAGDLSQLSEDDTVVVYLHGNSATRAFNHRLELYRVLASLGKHVITFDYRAFGDSSPVNLSEETVVVDSYHVLSWLEERLYTSLRNQPLVLVWGHSLGAAVATHTLHRWRLQDRELRIDGLVLEAAFNQMEDEVRHFKLARAMARLFSLDIAEELRRAGAEFRSWSYLANLTQPTLVIHSEDDPIVPYQLGEKLVSGARAAGKENIHWVLYSKELRLRHRYIYQAPGVKEYISQLAQLARQGRRDGQVPVGMREVNSVQEEAEETILA